MVTPYVVAARKYRPKTLQQLIGQNLLVQALTAAFTLNRIPHAFMLTGIRGVGKTTTARILAAGLNCSAADAPTLTPCGQCPQCMGSAQGNHPDIIEIDAASNNGVDNVREIVDSVRYKPVDARYRVFIIDEVHMLSKAAFNALLKTLEEPPPHAIFILATTELNKVPVTVLSRCRRLPLQRVDSATLQAHLLHVCQNEGFSCAPDAALALALAADGSVRDALSLLDQAIACATPTDGITRASVDAMLGLCSPEAAASLLEHICTGQPQQACVQVQQLVSSGLATRQVLTMILDVLTALLKVSAQVQTPDTFMMSGTLEAQLRRMAQHLTPADIMAMWQVTATLYDEAQHLPDGINILEHLVLRLSYANTLPPLPQLLQHLQGDTLPTISARAPMPVPMPPVAPMPVAAPPRPTPVTAPVVKPTPTPTTPTAQVPDALNNDATVQSALRSFPHAVITLNRSAESTAEPPVSNNEEEPDV